MTVGAARLLSIALWIVPILVVQLVRARRDRPAWAVALDVPFAVALDFLTLIVMARFVRLETAILVSRPAWLLAGTGAVARRWVREGARPAWPTELRWRHVAAVVIACTLGFLSGANVSHESMIWDLDLHSVNATALPAQKLPFVNALWPKEPFHYHFSGDAFAGILRTLSGDVLTSTNGLHTAHDLLFAAMAGTVTLLALGLGMLRIWPAILAGIALLLQGPIALRGAGLGETYDGYTYHNFFHLSYRPHVPLAGLMLVGVLGTLAVRAKQPTLPARATLPVLFATLAQLGVTDETSTGAIGLALGVAWLVDPRLIAGGRLPALVALLGLGVAFGTMQLVSAGSLAPGGPLTAMTFSPIARMADIHWRLPEQPLSTKNGKIVFFFDFLPVLLCGTGLALFAASARSRAQAGVAAFTWALIAMAVVLIPRLEINHDPAEVQRFWVAPFFAGILLGVVQLHRMPRGSLASMLILGGVAVPALFTMRWLVQEGGDAMMHEQPLAKRLNELDCRETVGAHLGDSVAAVYVEPSEWWTVSSCRPVFHWGESLPVVWSMHLAMRLDSMTQLRRLDENLADRAGDVDAFCRIDRPTSDPVCARALENRPRCQVAGTSFLRCPLTAGDRVELLGRVR